MSKGSRAHKESFFREVELVVTDMPAVDVNPVEPEDNVKEEEGNEKEYSTSRILS